MESENMRRKIFQDITLSNDDYNTFNNAIRKIAHITSTEAVTKGLGRMRIDLSEEAQLIFQNIFDDRTQLKKFCKFCCDKYTYGLESGYDIVQQYMLQILISLYTGNPAEDIEHDQNYHKKMNIRSFIISLITPRPHGPNQREINQNLIIERNSKRISEVKESPYFDTLNQQEKDEIDNITPDDLTKYIKFLPRHSLNIARKTISERERENRLSIDTISFEPIGALRVVPPHPISSQESRPILPPPPQISSQESRPILPPPPQISSQEFDLSKCLYSKIYECPECVKRQKTKENEDFQIDEPKNTRDAVCQVDNLLPNKPKHSRSYSI